MSKVYKSFVGVLGWDLEQKVTATGKEIKKGTIKLVNTVEEVKVGVTFWPELHGLEVKQGDILFVEGEYEFNDPYHNLSVSRAAVLTMEGGQKGSAPKAAAATPTAQKSGITF